MERTNTYLNNVAYSLLMVFAFVMMLTNSFAEIVAVAILFIWIAQTIAYRRRNWLDYPLFLPLVAFTGYKLIVLLVNGHGGTSNKIVEQMILPMIYFMVPTIVVNTERRRKIIWLLIAGAVIAASIGIIKFFTGDVKRASSIVSGWYTLAIYLSFCLIFVISLGAYAKKIQEKIFYALMSLPLILGVIVTFTRAIYVTTTLSAFIIGIYKDRRLLAFILVAIALIFIFSPQVNDMFVNRFDTSDMKKFYSYRDVIWSFGLPEAKEPGFFGYGLNSYSKLLDTNHNAKLEKTRITNWHNMYLQHLLDGGPFLLLILIWMFMRQFKYSFDIFRKTKDGEQKLFQIAVIMVLISFLAIGLFADPFQDPIISMLFWILMGLSLV